MKGYNRKSQWLSPFYFAFKMPIVSDWFFLVAGKDQISNFLEGYELVVELWVFMSRRDDRK
jgi:hypothetical protein